MEVENVECALQPWLIVCQPRLEESLPDFDRKSKQEQLKIALQQCLAADFNLTGCSCLPSGVQGFHANQLRGRYLLQLDEVVNIAAPAKHRYQPGGGHRCLKLLLTDGSQQVAGLEYESIPALHAFTPAGIKVLVHNPMVRRGMLLLTPNNFVVLGGRVDKLEQARHKAIERWNQPAVGRRGPPAQIQELVQQASTAAWSEQGEQQPATNHHQQSHLQQQQPQQPPTDGQHRPPQQAQQHPPQQQHKHHQGQQLRPPQEPPAPQSALAALRQPPPPQAVQPRQQLQLAAPPRAESQQDPPQVHHFVPARQLMPEHSSSCQQQPAQASSPSQEGGHPSFGSLPLRQRLQLQLRQAQPTDATAVPSFSFGMRGSVQEQVQSQSIGMQGGSLQTEQNPEQALDNARRSRLQLRNVSEAAGFSFAEHGPQLQAQQQLSALQDGQPPAAAAAAAAGSSLDPIVIDDDCDNTTAAQPMQVEAQQGQRAAVDHHLAATAGRTSEGGHSDWEDPPPPHERPQLEPYEQGFDEVDAEGDMVQLADGVAEAGEGGELEGEADDWGEDWEEEEVWEAGEGEGEGDKEQEGERCGGAEAGRGDIKGRRGGAAVASERVGPVPEAGDPERAASPSPAVAEVEALMAAATQPLGGGHTSLLLPSAASESSGGTGAGCAAAAGDAAHQAQEGGSSHAQEGSGEGAKGRPEAAARSGVRCGGTQRKRHIIESDEEEGDGMAPLNPAPSAGDQRQQPSARGCSRSPPSGAELAAELALAPLDDSLLRPAPSLADLMRPDPSPATSDPFLGLPLPPSNTPPQRDQQAAHPPAGEHPAGCAGPQGGTCPAPLPLACAGKLPAKGGSVALGGGGGGSSRSAGGSSGCKVVQLRPGLRTGQTPSGRGLAPAKASAAVVRGHGGAVHTPEVVVLGDSDDDEDAPVFDGLVDDEEEWGDGSAGAACPSTDHPFTYLFLLAERVKAAAPGDYPLSATIFGVVKTMVGKLQFSNPDTGAQEYHVGMMIEDGTMVCQARLGHQFMQELFELPPQQLRQQLSDPSTKGQAMRLVQTLQQYLGTYSGLMRLALPAPRGTLVVEDLLGGLTPQQAAALQSRAMG